MLNIGKLGAHATPTAQEATDCSMFLNMMVKQWMGRQDFAPGLKMWARKRGNLFLSASTGQYSLGPTGDNWTNTFYRRQLSAASAASDTTLTVDSITNASSGDYIGVVLDDGTLHWTTINGAPGGSTITLTTGVASAASSGAYVFNYTTKAQRPLYLETCVLRDTDSNDVPIRFLTLDQYQALPSKTNTQNQSDPCSVYYESQLDNGVLYTDTAATQDVSKYLHIVYMEPIQDFDAATDNPHFPQQWYLPLAWGLAKQIAPMFNAVWTQDMEANYQMALVMAKEADAETSVAYFQPGEE